MDVSIVVSPRERYSSLVATLEELVRTVPHSTPIVIVEGGSPKLVKHKISEISSKRSLIWVSQKNPILPNVARNMGFELTQSKYVVFVDNDITFEAGWLESLVDRAEKDSADVVAPLICIGPPRAKVIHHAGGYLELQKDGDHTMVKEHHRLMDVPIEEFSPQEALPANEVGEFHCILVRRSLMERIGPLDERLITREQMDFALRCMEVGARVRFERASVVTYSSKVRFTPSDLNYHLFRWSDVLVEKSLDTFEKSWGITLERHRIRNLWIANHRQSAFNSCFPLPVRIVGRFFGLTLARSEASVIPKVNHAMQHTKSHTPPKKTAEELLSNQKNNI